MADVVMYMRPMCPFCSRAESLLNAKGVSYEQFDIWQEAGRREEMIQRSKGATTVPQIFIGGQHVGGSDDLIRLEQQGKLDQMLAG